MSFKYHPDNLKTGNKEKIQAVNEAYVFLKTDLSNSYTYFDLEAYKREKLGELEKKTRFDFYKYENIPFDIEKLLRIAQAKWRAYIIIFSTLKTKSEVDDKINSLILPNIRKSFKEIKNTFYQEYEYGIETSKFDILLDYDDDLESFYDTLLEIKDKYSREVFFEQKLDRKIIEYKTRDGYIRLAKVIERIKNKCIRKRYEFETDGVCIKYFDDIILNTFDVMYDYETQISKMKEICSNIEDDEIKKKLECLLIKFNCIEEFDDIKKDLVELQRLVKVYEKEQERLKIPSYYGMILDRYTSSLQRLTGSGYLQEASEVSSIFQRAIQFMQEIESGKREAADLEILSRITFSNYDQDLELFSMNVEESFNDIYIFNKQRDDYNELLIGKVISKSEDEIKMIGYKDRMGFLCLRCIPIEFFKAHYVSLEDFLNNSRFCGFAHNYYDSYEDKVVYESDYLLFATSYITIYYYKEDSSFRFNGPIVDDLSEYMWVDDSEIRSFEDKKLIKNKISKYFEREIEAKWVYKEEKVFHK